MRLNLRNFANQRHGLINKGGSEGLYPVLRMVPLIGCYERHRLLVVHSACALRCGHGGEANLVIRRRSCCTIATERCIESLKMFKSTPYCM